MRYLNFMALSVLLFLSGVAMPADSAGFHSSAQTQSTAQEKAARLRGQLSEVEAKQSELQTRLQKLEEGLKAENIEKSLAGVGSTRPEDLREQRRRQLEIERNGVRAQLDLLTVSHSRIETAIAQADADAYRQSAAPVTATTPASTDASVGGPNSAPTNEVTAPKRQRRVRKKKTRKSKPAHHARVASWTSFGHIAAEAEMAPLTPLAPTAPELAVSADSLRRTK